MEVEYCRQCLMLVKSEYVEKYELSLVEGMGEVRIC